MTYSIVNSRIYPMGDLNDMQNRIVAFRDARDWRQFHNPKDMAVSLVLEASEFLEHFQWKSNDEVEDYLKSNINAVSEELADTLYWILLIANDLDINLAQALSDKMKKNEKKYPVDKAKGKHTKYTELKSK